jgi:ribosome-binding factor A
MQRELAQLIREEIRDPRLGMITLSGVEVARDMAHAKIFFTVLDEQAHEPTVTLAILNKAAGFLRHALGQRMIMRAVPQLHFSYDDTTARGAHINALIESALAKDAHKDDEE